MSGDVTLILTVFQSTHPCGVRPLSILTYQDCRQFQSTHPCGVRLYKALDLIPEGRFQSTHPCGVRLQSVVLFRLGRLVSIHAPLRGATFCVIFVLEFLYGFNPRTPAGCDSDSGLWIKPYPMFQSTHPCGVRHWHTNHVIHRTNVSIHAPLRGATSYRRSIEPVLP